MLVVGQMMEYFERHPDKNAMALIPANAEPSARVHEADADAIYWSRLEQNGVILRTQSADPTGGLTLLSFSESGVRSFMKNRELTLARIRRIIERFGYEDARTLLSLLRRLTLIYESETQADK